jgi:large subunit ribosomal protein L15
MILDDIHRGIKKRPNRKRIGRGPGSGQGKTAGKGHKGYYSRSGSPRRLGYEGGQMPLPRRIAKSGFSNARFAVIVAEVNVSELERVFNSGDEVNPTILAEKGVLKGKYDIIKVLGNGELKKKLKVTAHRFSKSAEEKIIGRGGSIERIPTA